MTTQKSPAINSAININTASAENLEKLPHVGPKLANEIISFRERHGYFRRPEQLMLIRGFSDARYREVRDFIKTE
jgi:competence protein ComEA